LEAWQDLGGRSLDVASYTLGLIISRDSVARGKKLLVENCIGEGQAKHGKDYQEKAYKPVGICRFNSVKSYDFT